MKSGRFKILLFLFLLIGGACGYSLFLFSNSTSEDYVIVTTNSIVQAKYWEIKLKELDTNSRKYLVVHEDWPGGADNGLGSLYAFKQGNKKAQNLYGVDLKNVLNEGGSVSLFHCAGMGKRLYPLTASEYNNKSAIKVPSHDGMQSVLELVLDQTLSQVSTLKGRLSVYWGDQIFIPSKALKAPESHVAVFTMVSEFPSRDEWREKHLDQYGLIIINDKKSKLVEKTSYSNLLNLVAKEPFGNYSPKVGVSLGSFSLSGEMLSELLVMFNQELEERKGKLNTDYHFWMPLTWTKPAYERFMVAKGYEKKEVGAIYDRMQTVKKELENHSARPVFGVQNVGEEALWWDFGNLHSYYQHLMALLERQDEMGERLKTILGVNSYYHKESNSLIINSEVEELNVRNSIVVNVQGKRVSAQDAILINSYVEDLSANGSIVYNVSEPNTLELSSGSIRADIFFNDEPKHVVFYSQLTRNNKGDWKIKLPKNEYAFEDIYHLNEVFLRKNIEAL